MVTKFTNTTPPKTEIFYPETDGMPLPDSREQGSFLREIAAELGALEYWRYDPTGGEHYGEPLVGEYRRFEMISHSE